jgi:hypothetical protein
MRRNWPKPATVPGQPADSAKKPGLMERAGKWSQRHKQIVALGLVVLVLAVLGLTVSNILVARERS